MASWSEPPATVDAYIKGLSEFARPVVEKLRGIIRSEAPHLEEAIRWNEPSYKGRLLVCSFSAFQKHVALTFPRGAELEDPKGTFVQGQGKTAIRSVRYTELAQVDEKMVRKWIKAAVELDANGGTVAARPLDKPKEPVIPEILAKALAMKKYAKANAIYDSLTTHGRREYCDWINSAKDTTTAKLRVKKSVEKLMDGEGLNDRYRA